MTAPRHPGSTEAALLTALGKLSVMAIEEATGKSQSYLYKCANTDAPQRLALADAIAIDQALVFQGDAPLILPRATALCGLEPATPNANLDASLRRAMQGVGDLAGTVDDALADGELDINECRDIAKRAQEPIDALTRIRDHVSPAGPRGVE